MAEILGPIAIRYRDASRQRTWSADSGPCDRVRVDSSARRREDGLLVEVISGVWQTSVSLPSLLCANRPWWPVLPV